VRAILRSGNHDGDFRDTGSEVQECQSGIKAFVTAETKSCNVLFIDNREDKNSKPCHPPAGTVAVVAVLPSRMEYASTQTGY
jgi:hypothetical protein